MEIIRKLSKTELTEFYNQWVCHNATGRKVLHVVVRSELCDGPPECDIDAEMKKFCTTVGTTLVSSLILSHVMNEGNKHSLWRHRKHSRKYIRDSFPDLQF